VGSSFLAPLCPALRVFISRSLCVCLAGCTTCRRYALEAAAVDEVAKASIALGIHRRRFHRRSPKRACRRDHRHEASGCASEMEA
jgi:hypothetical protein